jgi:hypothetical protein
MKRKKEPKNCEEVPVRKMTEEGNREAKWRRSKERRIRRKRS